MGYIPLSHGTEHGVVSAGMVVGEGRGCAGAAAGGWVGFHPRLLCL